MSAIFLCYEQSFAHSQIDSDWLRKILVKKVNKVPKIVKLCVAKNEFLQKWLENNMGQTESKGTPKTSLTSPVPQISTPAHHPVQSPKNSTGSSPGHLQVPVQRVRRKSIDSVFEEIFKSNTKSTDPEGCRTPIPSPVKDSKPPKSPLLSAVRKASGWLELPVPGRRSRRPSTSEQGPITIKSLLGRNTGSDDWHDDGLPKIPKNEIFDAPKEVEDDGEETPQFRGRASTIGNGQIPRLANRTKNDSEVVKLDKSKEVKVQSFPISIGEKIVKCDSRYHFTF